MLAHIEANLVQCLLVPKTREEEQPGGVDVAAGKDDLLFGINHAIGLFGQHPVGHAAAVEPLVDNQAVRARAAPDDQILAAQRRPQKGIIRMHLRAVCALAHGREAYAGAFLSVQVCSPRQAGGLCRGHELLRKRVDIGGLVRDVERPVLPVVTVLDRRAVLHAIVVLSRMGPPPLVAPSVQCLRVVTEVQRQLDEGAAAKPPRRARTGLSRGEGRHGCVARLQDARAEAVVSGEVPVHDELIGDYHRAAVCGRRRTCNVQQQHGVLAGLREPVGQDATSQAPPYDHKVELLLFGLVTQRTAASEPKQERQSCSA
mmetsp:Transcript_48310/g.154287  ORF Transcript_48310/g.154287 Transcript_48310/m.154287 type:complete len:315 (+) Transcript_48310:1287-2231(+)